MPVDHASEADIAVGKVAQDISGTDGDGSLMKLSDFRGKVVLLDFWQTH
jgi:peroxiredoxin